MITRTSFLPALFVALLSCRTLAQESELQDYVAYQATPGWQVEVFDVAENKITFGGREILGPRRIYSEFRGPIEPCDDPAFYCYVTGLHVAVPRSGTAPSWRAGRNECRVLDAPALLADRPVRILCRTSEQDSVEFSFSRARGIISYRRQCPGCHPDEYVLIGARGLFASP